MRDIISNHLRDKELKVIKMMVQKTSDQSLEDLEKHSGSTSSSDHSGPRSLARGAKNKHNIEIWVRRDGMRKKLDLCVDIHENENYECKIYNILFTIFRNYILGKHLTPRNYLCVPEHFLVWNPENIIFVTEPETEDTKVPVPYSLNEKVLLQENVLAKSYSKFMIDGAGLDYEHSVLCVSKLARLHATSFAYRHENGSDISSEYEWLGTYEPTKVEKETQVRLETIFKQSKQFNKYSSMFIHGCKGCQAKREDVHKFGVICHGSIHPNKVLFKYRSELESRLFCSDAVFKDLSQCAYQSCVVDLHHLFFTVISPEVREEFMADLICSVYYDSFASTIAALSPSGPMFSRRDFVQQFERYLTEGFNTGLNALTKEYEASLNVSTLIAKEPTSSYTEYRNNVLAMARDVLQFKVNAEATLG